MKYINHTENKKGILLASLFICLSLTAASAALFNLATGQEETADAVATVSSVRATATVSPAVFDGLTNMPIEDAVVVVAETGLQYKTDVSGKTGAVAVPVIYDARFDNILKKPWGEVTLLIYKDGYKPYVLFYLQVFADEDRSGPSIFLYGEDSASEEPFAIIESPNRLWVESLIKKFQP